MKKKQALQEKIYKHIYATIKINKIFNMKKKLCFIGSLLLSAIILYSQPKKDIELENGNIVQVSCLSDHIFRLQVSVDGQFTISPMEKYGIVRHFWPGSTGFNTEKKVRNRYFPHRK